MENLALLTLLFQVLLFLGSFTLVVFGYVYLTSSHGANASRKVFTSQDHLML
ncbi:hypothetical protein ACFSC6_01840 [Rufibacter sediminis]|uniref:Uncharacterized protein n=1 Tax=Rufibacter sediminis TaxID=2762756 RepID=A0ABR6VXP1_9BACT|nr:hypothetical protein [Rufibacter sediminis]MBC3541687.1 hypothetical protein [Rufibacter sediminis]